MPQLLKATLHTSARNKNHGRHMLWCSLREKAGSYPLLCLTLICTNLYIYKYAYISFFKRSQTPRGCGSSRRLGRASTRSTTLWINWIFTSPAFPGISAFCTNRASSRFGRRGKDAFTFRFGRSLFASSTIGSAIIDASGNQALDRFDVALSRKTERNGPEKERTFPNERRSAAAKDHDRTVLQRIRHRRVGSLDDEKTGSNPGGSPDGFATQVLEIGLRPGGQFALRDDGGGPCPVEFMKRAGMPLTNQNRITYTEAGSANTLSRTRTRQILFEASRPVQTSGRVVEFHAEGRSVRYGPYVRSHAR